MFQRRQDGSVDFYLEWIQYSKGFGNVSGEHWLGNSHVHALTNANRMQLLRVELMSYSGEKRFAEYADFSIESDEDDFALRLGMYRQRSNAGQLCDVY